MKKLFYLILIIAIASCNSDNPEAKRNELIKLKERERVIKSRIAVLEKEIRKDSVQVDSEKAIPVIIEELNFEEFNHFILINGNVDAEKHVFVSPELNGQVETQLEMARIRAPFSGYIEKISSKEGEMASPGKPILEIVNLFEMKIYGDVSEKYLANISEGDTAIVHFPSLPGIEIEVPVYRTGNVIDRNSRTFTIELKIKNPDNQLKPNLMTTVMLNDFSEDSALVVPSGIIKKDIQGSYLYVADDTGEYIIAHKAYIHTGLSYKDKTMITGGVGRGDKVIIAGYTEISDGVKIQIK